MHTIRSTVAIAGLVTVTALGLATATLPATAGAAGTSRKAAPAITVEKPPSATISESGSTLLYPLFNLWVPGYKKTYPQVTVQTAATGSGTGITDAINGVVEIGASDAYLPPTDLHTDPSLMNIPLAISAQLVVYNVPGVTAHLHLSGKVLAGIYRGSITTWNASAIAKLNPSVKLPATPIVTLHRADSSGDTFLFTSYLAKSTAGWATKIGYNTSITWPSAPGALGEEGNSGMVAGCKATSGCIAYVGISYETQVLGDGLVYAALENAKGRYVLPTPTTIKTEAAGFASKTPPNGAISLILGPSKNAYPIVNYEYAIVSKKQSSTSTATAVRSLLEWAIDPADGNSAAYLDQVNFQPLPSSIAADSLKQIKSIK